MGQSEHDVDGEMAPASGRRPGIARLWVASAVLAVLTAALIWVSFRPAADVPFLFDKSVFAWVLLVALLLSFLPVLAISHLLMFRGRRRLAWCVFIICQWAVCAFVIGDMSVYQVTSNHLNAYLMFIFQPKLLTIGGGSGLIERRVLALLSLAGVIVLAAAAAGWTIGGGLIRLKPGRRLLYILPALYVIPIISVVIAQRYVHSYSSLHDFTLSLPFDLSRYGLGPVPPDSSRFSQALSDTMRQSLVKWARVADDPPATDNLARVARKNPPNVVILVVDSLRRDMFDPRYMPRIYGRAQGGMIFLNHKPGANGTPWAMFDITYGRYSMFLRKTLDHGIKPELPAIFNRSGYQTRYYEGHDDSRFYELWKYVGPGSGFSQTTVLAHGDRWDLADQDILEHISDDLAHAKRPQMVLTLLSSVHYPYYYPAGFEKFTPVMDTHAKALTDMVEATDRTPLFNRYKNAVGYEDHIIGDFLDRIDLTKTVVLILGDHGESFWEDGFLTHAGPMSRIVMSVPCVWLGAGVPNRRVEMVTQHVDLLPTLLHVVAGRHIPFSGENGLDILDNPPPRSAWLACPPFVAAEGVTFIVNRPEDGIELYWSDDHQTLRYLGLVSLKGRLRPFHIPPVDHAEGWGELISPLLAHITR